MPFTEHLRELRSRLLIAIATVGGIAVLLFWPSQFVINWMMNEYFHGIQLHAFGPADVIFTEFKFSLVGGIVLGLPVLMHQLWMFVVPAIHPRTRRHGLRVHRAVAAARAGRVGVRALRRHPARHRGADRTSPTRSPRRRSASRRRSTS